MEGSTLLNFGLGIGGLILTFVLGIAALYQGSMPKHPQYRTPSTSPLDDRPLPTRQLQESSELSEFCKSVSQVIFYMALSTASIFFAILYLFIPFIICF